MEIEIKVNLDTEKPKDINLIEDLIEQLYNIREQLEDNQPKITPKKTTRRK